MAGTVQVRLANPPSATVAAESRLERKALDRPCGTVAMLPLTPKYSSQLSASANPLVQSRHLNSFLVDGVGGGSVGHAAHRC